MNTIPIKVAVTPVDYQVTMSAEQNISAPLALDIAVETTAGHHYEGDYTVAPSASEQVLETSGLILDGNITVAPIPSNYGLVTWNGAYLTIS